MKNAACGPGSVTTFVIIAVVMMIVSLVLLGAVASSALERVHLQSAHADAVQAENGLRGTRSEMLQIFALTTLVMGLTLVYLGARLIGDIRQRQQAEEKLRLTNARLELLNSMSHRLNVGGSLADAIQYSCDQLRGIFGYDYVELFLPVVDDRDLDEDFFRACQMMRGQGIYAQIASVAGHVVARTRSHRAFDAAELMEFCGREEILGLIADLAPPEEEDMEAIAPSIYDALGVSYVCQVPLLCEGERVGQIAIGKASGEPLPDREKRFLEHFAGQLALIITRARAEQALRESEQRYRMLFHSANDAMFVHALPENGPPGNFIAVNDVACERLGYSREELLRMSPADIDAPECWPMVPALIDQLTQTGRALYESRHRACDGREIPVEISSHLFELDGRPTVLSVARDISDRKHWEERLRRVNECFLGFGADPIDNIKSLTALAGEVLGADWAVYLRRENAGMRSISTWQTPEGLAVPRDVTGLICQFVMEQGETEVVALHDLHESRFAEVDPNVREHGARSYVGKAVVGQKGIVGTLCTFYRRNVTCSKEDERLIGIIAAAIGVEEERKLVSDEREKALEDLRMANRDLEMARHEAEEANRLKSEFLANTSHEIRTPLNGIIGYLQLVLNGLCDSEEEEREFLEGAAESARHLLSLINDVLDVAKIEAGKLRIEPGPVPVAPVLDDIRSLIRVQANQAGIDLRFERVDPELMAWCDEERFKQVLINLLGNAIKFTPEGGEVTVSHRVRHEEGDIRFEVADTGIGIPPDRIDTIFDKFVQIDGSTTRSRGGSGLGLTISQRLVELMGGAMGAASPGEGQGATFFFTLPLDRGERCVGWQGPQRADHGDRPLVLVVEDDPPFRRTLCDLLEDRGYATMWAATADDALEAIEEHRPAAITLDYGLPACEGARLNTGWDLLVELRQSRAFGNVPVVMVSGDAEVLSRRMTGEELPDSVEVIDKRHVRGLLAETMKRMLTAERERPRLLLVDDDKRFGSVLAQLIAPHGYELVQVTDGRDCLDLLGSGADDVDAVLLDLRMPGTDGYEVLRSLRSVADRPPVIVLTAWPEPSTLDERMVLASGGQTRLLTKMEVMAAPDQFVRAIDEAMADEQ